MINRRKFIINTAKSAGALTLLGIVPSYVKGAGMQPNQQFTVQQVIDIILKEGNLKLIQGTVDTIKAGSADAVVTGIVTTMFATIPVIEQTAKLGANFIIAHEPTFYNHADDKQWVKDNPVVAQKLALLDKYKITVWRCHDYMHNIQPEPMTTAIIKKAGWEQYKVPNDWMVSLPKTSLNDIVVHLKKTLKIQHVRVIGDLKQQCERVLIIPGAMDGTGQVGFTLQKHPDVLVVGELREWETAAFIDDARRLGTNLSLIILGHQNSEDPGTELFADWLQPKLTGIKVTHIASGDPFTWM
jgi:putative NIF3 family GTP cyclohydrolase 1 type 2